MAAVNYFHRPSNILKLLLILLHIQPILNQKLQLNILGLFTTTGCSPGNEFECQNALSNQNSMIEVHRRQTFWFDAHLCFKDIQNRSDLLIDTVLPLTTDEKQHYVTKDCVNKNGSFVRSSDRIVILTYLSFQLTKLVSSLILPLNSMDMVLVSITDRPMYP
uniref:Cnidarian restricted protein n=1 Tax=Clytia hemisphaerica TaxID=252671 RepID=A0A7M5XNH8_9CNID